MTGSKMRFFKAYQHNDGMDQFRKSPEEICKEIKSKGGDVVFTMQLDEPLNNANILMFDELRE